MPCGATLPPILTGTFSLERRAHDEHPHHYYHRPSSTGEWRRREPERGRGGRVTGLRPYGEARHPHRARRSEPGKPSKSERAFTVSCGRNSGSSSPAGRRIWSGNRQGGGIVNASLPRSRFYLNYTIRISFIRKYIINIEYMITICLSLRHQAHKRPCKM